MNFLMDCFGWTFLLWNEDTLSPCPFECINGETCESYAYCLGWCTLPLAHFNANLWRFVSTVLAMLVGWSKDVASDLCLSCSCCPWAGMPKKVCPSPIPLRHTLARSGCRAKCDTWEAGSDSDLLFQAWSFAIFARRCCFALILHPLCALLRTYVCALLRSFPLFLGISNLNF